MKLKQIKANVTELTFNDGTVVLFSYETAVAACTGNGYIRTEQKYSQTTTKHINQWINGARVETVPQAVIDNLIKG